jgi:hypothetical protein
LNIRQRACWDVRPLLLALGVEVEDTLVLVLNLRDHTAIGVAGEEDAIHSVKSGGIEIAAANASRPVRDGQEIAEAPKLLPAER